MEGNEQINTFTKIKTKQEIKNNNDYKHLGDYMNKVLNINLDEIWGTKNALKPNDYNKGSAKKVWIKCNKDITHPEYEISCNDLTRGRGCPYCSGKKICYTNSLGFLFPDSVNVWSDKNEKTVFEVPKSSNKKYYWKCPDDKHEDFLKTIDSAKKANFKCTYCSGWNIRNKDFSGERFGRLVVIKRDPESIGKGKMKKWLCQCDCGNTTSVQTAHLLNGATTSCGCYHKEICSNENNPHWKGGVSSKNQRERAKQENTDWRNKVFYKDNYTCQCCGNSKVVLNAHHIYNFADNEDKRLDIDNGITLCETHHRIGDSSFHKLYGRSNNTPEQLESYINQKRKELNIPFQFSLSEYNQRINILKPNTVEELLRTTNNNQNNI